MTTEEHATSDPFADRDEFWPYKLESWAEWLNAWQDAATDVAAEGLLYRGFETSTGYRGTGDIDRLKFYLALADDWNKTKVVRPGMADIEGRRQRLRVAAFKQLALSFFKNSADPDVDLPSWARDAIDPRLYGELLMFFRPSGSGYGLVNLPNWVEGPLRHPLEITTTFLRAFSLIAWSGREYPWSEILNPSLQAALATKRPKLVSILYAVNGRPVDFLKDRKYELDEPTRAKLTELALAQENTNAYYGEPKTVGSIEEAYACGSKAAEVLILRGISDAEELKQRQRREDLTAQREARSRAEELARLRALETEASAERIRLEAAVAADTAAGLLKADELPPSA